MDNLTVKQLEKGIDVLDAKLKPVEQTLAAVTLILLEELRAGIKEIEGSQIELLAEIEATIKGANPPPLGLYLTTDGVPDEQSKTYQELVDRVQESQNKKSKYERTLYNRLSEKRNTLIEALLDRTTILPHRIAEPNVSTFDFLIFAGKCKYHIRFDETSGTYATSPEFAEMADDETSADRFMQQFTNGDPSHVFVIENPSSYITTDDFMRHTFPSTFKLIDVLRKTKQTYFEPHELN